MDKNRLSIIVPVYNAEEYLYRCLDSIIDQSFSSYEVILVDDGSTDSSPLICDRYSATDPRFRTIHKANEGVGAARNAGINLAKGEYLMFIDADDALLPDALERMMEGVVDEDLIVAGYATFIDGVPESEILPPKARNYRGEEMISYFEDNIKRSFNGLDAPWAKMFRRKVIKDLRFRENLSYAEEKLFVLSFLAHHCSSVHSCDVPAYAYYIRPESLGSDVFSDNHLTQLGRFLPEYSAILTVLTERFPASEKIASLYHKDLVSGYVFRILRIFRLKRTLMLDLDYMGWVYGLMDADSRLGYLSVRSSQWFDLWVYKTGDLKFSLKVYRLISRLFHSWV